jgi:uncharacterized protein YgbK (DUF1537 family)
LPNPVPSPRLRILADDLTGACDAAAPFAARGTTTQVLLAPPFRSSGPAVQSLCTATRDVVPALASLTLRQLLQPLQQDRNAELFKKVDSVFRGNTLVEIAASLAALPDHLAVIAPAFPTQGRICQDGQLHLSDLFGLRTVPLRASFAAAGLYPRWLPPAGDPATLESAMRRAPAVFCEATCHHHLQIILRSARAVGRPILWIGSAGLAHALAEVLYPPTLSPAPSMPRQPGKFLVMTGSDHPVSQRQLTALTVPVLRIERDHTTNDQILTFLARHAPVATIVLNGGDTALHVCRALAITSLCLHGEYAPGIPIATARGGPYQGTRILLKSGGFGAADLLTRIAADYTQDPAS